MTDHDALISSLSGSAAPVSRPAPSFLRAAAWSLAALACGALAGLVLHRAPTDWAHPGAAWAAFELVAAAGLGLLAIFSAFEISIAGRRPASLTWLAAGSVLWVAIQALAVMAAGQPYVGLSLTSSCYIFILLVSAPMLGLMVLALRRTRSCEPGRALAIAGLGVSFLALALLTLCHSAEARPSDFLMHLAAGLTVTVVSVVVGRRCIAIG